MMKLNKKLLILTPILILFGISTYYVLTTSNLVRFWADDFCSSVLLRNNGYFNSQLIWWKGWTGRYSSTFFTSLIELFGLEGAKLLPVIQYILFSVSSLFIFTFSFPIAIIFTTIFLLNSSNIIQSFYWMTGSLNYFAPFIFLNFFLSLLFLKYKKYFKLLGFIILFIATGFSESFGVANLLLLTFLIFVIYFSNFKKKKEKYSILIFGVISTLLSLFLMYLAPGNAVRSSTVTHPSGFVDLVTKTYYYSKWYLTHLLYIKTFVISILLIIISAFLFLNKKIKYFSKPKLIVFTYPIYVLLITISVVGLTYFAMNWEPPERVMSIVNNMIIIGTIIFSIALFDIFKKYVPELVTKLLFLIFIVLLIFRVNTDWGNVRRELQEYASKWDIVEKDIIVSKSSKVFYIDNIKPVGKLDGFVENKGWVLSCITSYYKLDKIVVKE